MRSRLLTHRLGGWIALWALAFAALAPAISQLLRGDAAPAWLEVCTPAGARFVSTAAEADRGTGQKQSPADLLFDHCPYCALQHAVAALPASTAGLTLLPLSFGFPARFLSAPRTPFAWTTSQPRGPPLSN